MESEYPNNHFHYITFLWWLTSAFAAIRCLTTERCPFLQAIYSDVAPVWKWRTLQRYQNSNTEIHTWEIGKNCICVFGGRIEYQGPAIQCLPLSACPLQLLPEGAFPQSYHTPLHWHNKVERIRPVCECIQVWNNEEAKTNVKKGGMMYLLILTQTHKTENCMINNSKKWLGVTNLCVESDETVVSFDVAVMCNGTLN